MTELKKTIMLSECEREATKEEFMDRLTEMMNEEHICECCPGVQGFRMFNKKDNTPLFYCNPCKETSGVQPTMGHSDGQCPCHYHGTKKAIEIAVMLVEEWNS